MTVIPEFVPADRNTGVAANDTGSTERAYSYRHFEFTDSSGTVSLPIYVPTAQAVASAASSIDDEDEAFLAACRHRLAAQFDDAP